MTDWLIHAFASIPPVVGTLLMAMTPIGELRLALPLALTTYHLSLPTAFFLSVAGNVLAVTIILLWIDPLARWLRRWRMFDRLFTWLFARTRRNFTDNFKRWGALGLVVFVAIPLPMTGGWSGALAAYLFGIPFRVALPLVALGVLLSGVIVASVTLGAIRLF